MSIAADSNTGTDSNTRTAADYDESQDRLERALAAVVLDTGDPAGMGDLLDVLRTARLWLPLPDGTPGITGTALTLPTVTYLGTDFVPAYSSARLLTELAGAGLAHPAGPVAHAVVHAADLARLLPPTVGIVLNAGASTSVPVYPQAVSYLAGEMGSPDDRITIEPLPVRPDRLLAAVAAGLLGIAAVQSAAAAWLTIRSGGEGLLIAVSLDDAAAEQTRDQVAATVERAAWEVEPGQAGFPIDVLFRDLVQPDSIDERVSAVGTPFYRRQ